MSRVIKKAAMSESSINGSYKKLIITQQLLTHKLKDTRIYLKICLYDIEWPSKTFLVCKASQLTFAQ